MGFLLPLLDNGPFMCSLVNSKCFLQILLEEYMRLCTHACTVNVNSKVAICTLSSAPWRQTSKLLTNYILPHGICRLIQSSGAYNIMYIEYILSSSSSSSSSVSHSSCGYIIDCFVVVFVGYCVV